MKYYIINLGCKVNAYEAKVMSDLLENNGYLKGSIDDADIYIVNTCFVTNVAEHKSLQMIHKAIKKNHKLVIVCGCLSQMKSEEILNIPGVDIVLGNKDKSKIIDYINNYKEKISKIYDLSNVEFEDMQLNNFDKTRAFVKIQDGCNNFCSYCIIPYTRGNIRSKKKEDVLSEINNLVKNGHKEVVLTGIHTGNYHDNNYDFADLLSDIVKNIIFLKRGIVDNLFFSKVSAIGFFLFIFQLLIYITFLFISSKVYFLLITILPFWIFTVVYFKKKIFDNYDVVLECLKNGRFISFFILTFLTILVLLGMVFMYIGFTGSSFYMYKDYIVTTGYYTEYEAIKTEEGLNYKLIYSYNVDGVDYLVETEYYTNNLPNEGAARNIKYNPLNHSQAIVVGGGAGDVLLLVGFMFFIIPLVLQIKNRRQKKRGSPLFLV